MSPGKTAAPSCDRQYGSDVLVDLLVELGTELIAFAPGATFRGLHDSLVNYAQAGPEVIECLHEEIAVAIAHGYAKATGRPMTVALHNVVGLQHAAMAIYNAWCDRVPMLLIGGTGPVDAALRRPWIDGIHTANVQGSQIRDYTKWDDQPASVEALTESFVRAYRLADAAPRGPVYVCVDSTIQEQPLPAGFDRPAVAEFAVPQQLAVAPSAVDTLADRLVSARSPLIVAEQVGRDQRALELLVAISELIAAPVAELDRDYNRTALCFPTQHPLNMAGMSLLHQPDVVLALEVGELREVEGIGSGSWVAEISTAHLRAKGWAAELQRIHRTSMSIPAEVAPVLEELLPALRRRLDEQPELRAQADARRDEISAVTQKQRAAWLAHAVQLGDGPRITRPYLAWALDQATRAHPRVLANGNLHNWVHRLWSLDRTDAYLGGSGGAGLGYGLGASIGAALAHRGTDTLVIDIQSDGDALMTPSALWTAARHDVPLLIVMDNNRRYDNSVQHAGRIARARARSQDHRLLGTGLAQPCVDFAGLATSFGVHALDPVTDPQELSAALDVAVGTVLRDRRTVLVDVVTDADQV